MPGIRKEKDRNFIEFTEKEAKELGLETNLFELNKVKNILVLTATEKEKSIPAIKQENVLFDETKKEADEKIFELLSEKGKTALTKKVEGTFEQQLNEKELKRFNELLEQGIIEKFKLNESYKKAIYRIKKQEKKENKEFDVNSEEKTIESNGFEVMVNEGQAKNFCEQFSEEIKENKIKGIKGFDGYFYAIDIELMEKIKPKILFYLKNKKNVSLNELTEKTSLPTQLIRAVNEFLKEDGEIIEKRKGIYQLIE